MKSPTEAVNDFGGVVKNIAPAKMPPQLFQEDVGGDRTRQGSWKRRRGIAHTTIEKTDLPVTCIAGFSIPGISKGYMVCEGTNVFGYVDVEQQSDLLTPADAGRFYFAIANTSGAALLLPGI